MDKKFFLDNKKIFFFGTKAKNVDFSGNTLPVGRKVIQLLEQPIVQCPGYQSKRKNKQLG